MKALNCLYFTVLVILLTGLSSCNKDSLKSRKDLLTEGNWIIRGYTDNPGYDFDGDGDNDTNFFVLLDACDKDDFLNFYGDGSGASDQGSNKCDPFDPQRESFSWYFTDNDNRINIDGDDWNITELTSSRFAISNTYNSSGVSHTRILSFSH